MQGVVGGGVRWSAATSCSRRRRTTTGFVHPTPSATATAAPLPPPSRSTAVVNDAPVAQAAATVAEDSANGNAVTATDVDVDGGTPSFALNGAARGRLTFNGSRCGSGSGQRRLPVARCGPAKRHHRPTVTDQHRRYLDRQSGHHGDGTNVHLSPTPTLSPRWRHRADHHPGHTPVGQRHRHRQRHHVASPACGQRHAVQWRWSAAAPWSSRPRPTTTARLVHLHRLGRQRRHLHRHRHGQRGGGQRCAGRPATTSPSPRTRPSSTAPSRPPTDAGATVLSAQRLRPCRRMARSSNNGTSYHPRRTNPLGVGERKPYTASDGDRQRRRYLDRQTVITVTGNQRCAGGGTPTMAAASGTTR